jgi:hypothetical protein
VRKKLGLNLVSEKTGEERIYRIVAKAASAQRKSASNTASMMRATARCSSRSATVGIPFGQKIETTQNGGRSKSAEALS